MVETVAKLVSASLFKWILLDGNIFFIVYRDNSHVLFLYTLKTSVNLWLLPPNCLNVFDYFIGLAFKGLQDFFVQLGPNLDLLCVRQSNAASFWVMQNFILMQNP